MKPDAANAFAEVIVPESLHGLRLDKALRELLPDQSRAYLRDLVKGGFVRVGRRRETKPRYLCQQGDRIQVELAPRVADDGTMPPEFRVIHVDDAILVIDKPAGLAAHRNEREARGTVADYAQRDFGLLPSLQGDSRPGIVHRLDKDTSGVMVLARTAEAFHLLREQFRARIVQKEYRALVYGTLRFDSEWIEQAIGRDPARPTRMSVMAEGGRESATLVESVERFRDFSHVLCRPKTGRTHQIRVHLTWLGHAIVGDRVYRPRRGRTLLPDGAPHTTRHLLHARAITFVHPVSGEEVTFEAPLPDDFERFRAWLRSRQD